MWCARQSPLCPTAHHAAIAQLCGQGWADSPTCAACAIQKVVCIVPSQKPRGDLETLALGCCHRIGEVGLKEARSFSMPSRSLNRTLELNSRERTWREWISNAEGLQAQLVLATCRRTLFVASAAASGEYPVLSLSIFCQEPPSQSHILRGPCHEPLLPGPASF